MNDGVQRLPALTDGKGGEKGGGGGGGVMPRDTDDSSRGERVLLFCVKAWCHRPGPCLCIVQGRGEGRVLKEPCGWREGRLWWGMQWLAYVEL
ncbi:hypothetical protein E2C01_047002 [Portunus trituberculatus]|uniref:Uncharacterized protein n=1 Tax=Portunus trituberculatus TaxID=210409 RepID=A0A5B7G6D7_PORTR|nr:hypothetical protein [Portunus trituberculatus]